MFRNYLCAANAPNLSKVQYEYEVLLSEEKVEAELLAPSNDEAQGTYGHNHHHGKAIIDEYNEHRELNNASPSKLTPGLNCKNDNVSSIQKAFFDLVDIVYDDTMQAGSKSTEATKLSSTDKAIKASHARFDGAVKFVCPCNGKGSMVVATNLARIPTAITKLSKHIVECHFFNDQPELLRGKKALVDAKESGGRSDPKHIINAFEVRGYYNGTKGIEWNRTVVTKTKT